MSSPVSPWLFSTKSVFSTVGLLLSTIGAPRHMRTYDKVFVKAPDAAMLHFSLHAIKSEMSSANPQLKQPLGSK